jgi:hypothetical protein
MKVLYRISDGGHNKIRPHYLTHSKERMFVHFLNTFKSCDVYVFADNVGEDTYNFLHLLTFQTPIIN